jgi:hypothetical protein
MRRSKKLIIVAVLATVVLAGDTPYDLFLYSV